MPWSCGSQAANRRAPVIRWLRIVFGAANETGPRLDTTTTGGTAGRYPPQNGAMKVVAALPQHGLRLMADRGYRFGFLESL